MYYYPFGGTRSDTGSVSVNHKYTSQELDSETGLYYYNARYYNPQLGRFISPDTVVPGKANPQAFNRYSYVENNPLLYIDPSGHVRLKPFMKAVATGIVAGAVFFATGGTGAPILAGMLAGAASGATSVALNGGNFQQMLQAAAMGAAFGAVGGGISTFGTFASSAMLGGGAAYATATDGLNGLAYFAGGFAGGMMGYRGGPGRLDRLAA